MSEVPILFMKTGIINSAPEGFYTDIAEHFGAVILSASDLRAEIELEDNRLSQKEVKFEVNDRLEEQSLEALRNGESVVYDAFLNTFARRETVRERVTRPCGAATVLLSVRASNATIQQRIRERHGGDPRTLSQHLAKAALIAKDVQWPRAEQHLELRGHQDTSTLLEIVEGYVRKRNLR